jgi:rRNA processing protein Krr1/Pno1
MGKFQNVNFEKPVVIKVAHGFNNKKIVLQLLKISRSSTHASALKIKNFIVEATF